MFNFESCVKKVAKEAASPNLTYLDHAPLYHYGSAVSQGQIRTFLYLLVNCDGSLDLLNCGSP